MGWVGALCLVWNAGWMDGWSCAMSMIGKKKSNMWTEEKNDDGDGEQTTTTNRASEPCKKKKRTMQSTPYDRPALQPVYENYRWEKAKTTTTINNIENEQGNPQTKLIIRLLLLMQLLFTGYMLRMSTPKSTLTTTASAARSERHPKRRKRRRIPSTKHPIGHRRRRARHKRTRGPRQRCRRHPWRRGRIEPRRWGGKVPTAASIRQRITATAAAAAVIVIGTGTESLRLGLSERRRKRRRESRVSPEDRRRQLHAMLKTWVMTSKVLRQSRVRMERILSI